MWEGRDELSDQEARRKLKRLELEAYSGVVYSLRAQGELDGEKRELLATLRRQLGVSEDRHRAEIRRAVNDEELEQIADKITGEDTSTGWMDEGKRQCPTTRRKVLPLRHLQNLVNNGVATVAASVALGLADLPRKEAESGSSKLQPFSVVGDELTLLRGSTNDPVSMAVAKILEASVLSRNMDEDNSGSGGMVASRRGCKRKNSVQRGPLAVTVSPSPYQAATEASKQQRVVAPVINSQPITLNRQAQFVVNLPTAIPLPQLGTRPPPTVPVRQLVVSSQSVSQVNTPLHHSVACSAPGTNIPLTTTLTATNTPMLVSLYPVPSSTKTSSSVLNMLPSVSLVSPASTAMQQSTLSSVRSLLQQISSSSVSSPVVSPSAARNQPPHTILSSQALGTAASLSALPSHAPLVSTQNIAAPQLNQVIGSGTTVSIVPSASAQLVSGNPATVTVLNQQSLKALGNVFIVNSQDGQPGKAILLQHKAMQTIPTAFSLIPVSAAHIIPSNSPQLHTVSAELSDTPKVSISHVPQTVNLPRISHGHMTVTCSQSVSFSTKPIMSTSTCTTVSDVSQMNSASDEMVPDSGTGEVPDSEVTRAAEELVRLQARSVTSNEDTAALLLNNPSLLEATTTLLSLQRSAVLPTSRKVNSGDRNDKDEEQLVGKIDKPDGVVNGKRNTESSKLKVIESSDKDLTSKKNGEKMGDNAQRREAMPITTLPVEYLKDLKATDKETPNSKAIDKAVPRAFADECVRPSVDTQNDAKAKEKENKSSNRSSSTELSEATIKTLPSTVITRERVNQQNQLASRESGDKQLTTSKLIPELQASNVSQLTFVSTTLNTDRLDTTKTPHSVLSSFTTGLPRQPSLCSVQSVTQQPPAMVTSQALRPDGSVLTVYSSHSPVDLNPVEALNGHDNRLRPAYVFPPSPVAAQHQSGSVSDSPCSSSSTLILSSPAPKPNAVSMPFSATAAVSIQSTPPPTTSQHDISVSPSISHVQNTGIHLRIQGSTVTTRLPTTMSPLAANRPSSLSTTVSESPQDVTFKPVSLPISRPVPVLSQPTLSVTHSSVLDVLGDVAVSQSQDEADNDPLKSIIEDLGVNLDDPESFLAGDHLSLETSLDPDILSDVFAAISAADMTMSRTSPPTLSSVPPLTNELSTLRNFAMPTIEGPHSYSHQSYRERNQGSTGRGKRTGHVERSVSYSYPLPRLSNVITTRRSSAAAAAASLAEDGDGEDGSGLRQSKRKRKLTAIMTDDPYPAPKTETISVPSWVKAAIALMHRVCRVRGSNRAKSEASASSWFLDPVDIREIPDYCDKVKQPMDFSTIRKKLEVRSCVVMMALIKGMRKFVS
jgi:hypothetical protein